MHDTNPSPEGPSQGQGARAEACRGMLRGVWRNVAWRDVACRHTGPCACRDVRQRERSQRERSATSEAQAEGGLVGRRRTLLPERLLLARQVGHFKWRPTVRCMCHISCVTNTQYLHTNKRLPRATRGDGKREEGRGKREEGKRLAGHLDQIFAAWIAEEMSAW